MTIGKTTGDRTRALLAGTGALGLIAAIALWGMAGAGRRSVASDFAAAIGTCATDPAAGAARLRALKRHHGASSAPQALALDISLCELKASVSDYTGTVRQTTN